MLNTEHRGTLLLVFLIIILSGALWTGVSYWILTYINRTKNVTFIIAGGLSTLQYTIGAFAQIAGREFSDRIGRKTILLAGFGAFSVSLFLLTLVPDNFWLLLGLVAVLGFTFFMTQAPINALLGDISHKDTVGVTYGVNFTVKYGIGAILPAMTGWIAINWGLDFVFYFFSALSALAFVITLIVKEKRQRKAYIPAEIFANCL
jgi:MFS family permease